MKIKNLIVTSVLICGAIPVFSQTNKIQATGKVGIGTTTPTRTLDVRGKAFIDSLLIVGDSASIEASASIKGNLWVGDNAVIDENLTVLTTSFLTDVTVDGALNIPNLTPLNEAVNLLTVKEDGTVEKITVGNFVKQSNKPFITCSPITTNPIWESATSKLFSSCPDVFVGIGHNAPLYPLDVRGRGYMTGIRLGNIVSETSNSALIEGQRNAATNIPFIRMTVKNADNTTSTRFKLEQDGTVYCTSVKVRPTTSIPDYVFKPGYDLMPLKEVKNFVSLYSHLPNIPSEREIAENGLSLDEMQLKLLEKVEELTLYVIELNEKADQQAKENAALKAEMEVLKSKINE